MLLFSSNFDVFHRTETDLRSATYGAGARGARKKRPVAAVCFCTKNEGIPKTVACFALIASPHEQAGAVNTSFRRRPHVLAITRMLPALSRI